MHRISVVVVEDNVMYLDGLSLMLKAEPDIKLEAVFPDGEKVLPKIKEIRPNILLLNLGQENQQNLVLANEVKQELPSTRIVAIDLQSKEENLIQFVRAGVTGFILRKASVDSFLDTLRGVALGATVLPPPLIEALFGQIIINAEVTSNGLEKYINELKGLSKREREVVTLITEGMTNKEIGNNLNLSPYTIKSHIHSILDKLDLESRLQISNHIHSLKEEDTAENRISFLSKPPPTQSSS